MMFNVRPDTCVPGYCVRPLENIPGFRVDGGVRREQPNDGLVFPDFGPLLPAMANAIDAARYGFPGADDERSVGNAAAPALVPAPGGDGGSHGWDKCMLVAGFEPFGMCLYRCPDGTVPRSHGKSRLGCQPFIFRNDGLGL